MLLTRTAITPGPRDEKGVLAARILDVARETFAENGWAGTTIRGVARTADVDPALVYHYFKSKEALLDASTVLPSDYVEATAARWSGSQPDELGVGLVRDMLDSWRDENLRPLLRAIFLIAAHEPNTLDRLRSELTGPVSGPAAAGLSPKARQTRGGLIASQLVGFVFMRYIWEIEPLASMSDDEVVAAIAPSLQRYIDGEIAPVKKARTPRTAVKVAARR